jgi:hypothetical protein
MKSLILVYIQFLLLLDIRARCDAHRLVITTLYHLVSTLPADRRSLVSSPSVIARLCPRGGDLAARAYAVSNSIGQSYVYTVYIRGAVLFQTWAVKSS